MMMNITNVSFFYFRYKGRKQILQDIERKGCTYKKRRHSLVDVKKNTFLLKTVSKNRFFLTRELKTQKDCMMLWILVIFLFLFLFLVVVILMIFNESGEHIIYLEDIIFDSMDIF